MRAAGGSHAGPTRAGGTDVPPRLKSPWATPGAYGQAGAGAIGSAPTPPAAGSAAPRVPSVPTPFGGGGSSGYASPLTPISPANDFGGLGSSNIFASGPGRPNNYGAGQLGTGQGQAAGMGQGYWGNPDLQTAPGGRLDAWGPQSDPGAHPNQDAGSRRLQNSSVNWGGFNALNNYVNQPGLSSSAGAQRMAYLRSLGVNPTYNGQQLDRLHPTTVNVTNGYEGSSVGPGSAHSALTNVGAGPGFDGVTDADLAARDAPRSATTVNDGAPGGGGYNWTSGLGGWEGGLGGNVPGGSTRAATGGGGTGDPIQDAYARLIGSGGYANSASDRNAQEQQARDAANRATGDAVRAGRLDATRRGDTSLSSVGTNEGVIRQRGANMATQAGLAVRTGQSQQAQQNLLAALQGAGGYQGQQGSLQLMLAELQAQQQGQPLAALGRFS